MVFRNTFLCTFKYPCLSAMGRTRIAQTSKFILGFCFPKATLSWVILQYYPVFWGLFKWPVIIHSGDNLQAVVSFPLWLSITLLFMFNLRSLQQHFIYGWTKFPVLGLFLPHFVKSASMQYANINVQTCQVWARHSIKNLVLVPWLGTRLGRLYFLLNGQPCLALLFTGMCMCARSNYNLWENQRISLLTSPVTNMALSTVWTQKIMEQMVLFSSHSKTQRITLYRAKKRSNCFEVYNTCDHNKLKSLLMVLSLYTENKKVFEVATYTPK